MLESIHPTPRGNGTANCVLQRYREPTQTERLHDDRQMFPMCGEVGLVHRWVSKGLEAPYSFGECEEPRFLSDGANLDHASPTGVVFVYALANPCNPAGAGLKVAP